MHLNITQPTLLLDRQKCLNNIAFMAEKAKKHNLIFRPHFKTHQSHEIGQWFKEQGVDKITVSSLEMAEYFAQDGWGDITVAFPVNILEIDRINRLAQQVRLNLLVESLEAIEYLTTHLSAPISVFIKMDIGYHRTGIPLENTTLVDMLLKEIEGSTKLHFKGFLGHAGHSYKARGKVDIAKVHQDSLQLARKFKAKYRSQFPQLVLSVGDTPTCSAMDDFAEVDEIRPGNFVFYDLTQWAIGSCDLSQISVAMACPVVAKHETRSEIVVYGGGVHFSKDRGVEPLSGNTYFGYLVESRGDHWSVPKQKVYINSLSQEHGIIKADKALMEKTKVGDILTFLPIHSCMCSNLMKSYLTLDGENIKRL